MNFDSVQIQIFVSLVLVLGALAVAFLCDFLKGNNEVLRERNIELAVRQQERERLARPRRLAAGEPARQRAPDAAPLSPRAPVENRSAPPEPPPKPVEVKPRRPAAAKITPIDLFPQLGLDNPEGPDKPLLSEDLEHIAIAAREGPVSQNPELTAGIVAESYSPFTEESSEEVPELVLAGTSVPPETSPLESCERDMPLSAPAESEAALSLPTGMQDVAALEEALEKKEPFRGVVVAIGVSRGKDRQAGEAGESLSAVPQLIESLLTARDTAFRAGDDEFLLVLPDQTGANAQRRLQHISEVLWDHQIRSMATSWILFSWGSVEVYWEPLAKAIASARERMHQTKRNREKPAAEIYHYRRNSGRNV
jgi:hypothetical protein